MEIDWDKWTGTPWIKEGTIFLTKSGSHAYGTNIASSDLDIKGVAIPPKEYFFGFLNKFEQAESKSPDLTIFDIRKFFALAADCNPNIIEFLFVDEKDILILDFPWRKILNNRQLFLSQKAKHTFSGYAISQLNRIRTHKAWLLNPVEVQPKRSDFDLPDSPTLEKEQLKAFDSQVKKLEDTLGGKGWTKDKIEGQDEELVTTVVEKINISKSLIPIILNERRYNSAMRNWSSYQKWKTERNVVRSALEAQFGYDCYLDDTEFLTTRGWLKYDEIQHYDQLLTLNKETGKLEDQKFTDRVCKTYTGPIHFIENRITACAVTPNHRMWLSSVHRSKDNNFSTKFTKENSNWKIIQAQNTIKGKTYFHARSASEGGPGSVIKDDELILIGAYVSEGCVGKKNKDLLPTVLRVTQMENGRLCEFMEKFNGVAVESTFIPFKKYIYPRKNRKRKEITWTFANKQLAQLIVHWCGEKSKNKHLPSWIYMLDQRQARLLMEVLISGDGTNKKYSSVYYTVSKQLANDVQTLAILCGYGSQIWGPYPNKNNNPIYQIYINKNQYSVISPLKQKIEHVYNRRIVCFTVPNEILITRRNGKVSVQGNTKHAMHLVRLMRMAKEILSEGKVLVKRPDAEELLAIRRGAWSYDQLIEWATTSEKELDSIISPLPHSPNRTKIDTLLVDIVNEYLNGPY